MQIAILDCTTTLYTKDSAITQPIGGIERCIIGLSAALQKSGHTVELIKPATAPPTDFKAEIVIACNDACLFDRYANLSNHHSFKPILWLHNPVPLWKTIRKGRYAAIRKWNPTAVFLGTSQKTATSRLIPFKKTAIIEHGIEDIILNHSVHDDIPPPHAAFISQSYRGLDDVIYIWKKYIFPNIPNARLDIYANVPNNTNNELFGIKVKGRLPRQTLINELSAKRLIFIPGHKDETFCLAAAESQYLGIPVVTYGTGSLKERVIHGKTGYIAKNQQDFAKASVQILTNEALWLELHTNSVNLRPKQSWNDRIPYWENLFQGKK